MDGEAKQTRTKSTTREKRSSTPIGFAAARRAAEQVRASAPVADKARPLPETGRFPARLFLSFSICFSFVVFSLRVDFLVSRECIKSSNEGVYARAKKNRNSLDSLHSKEVR